MQPERSNNGRCCAASARVRMGFLSQDDCWRTAPTITASMVAARRSVMLVETVQEAGLSKGRVAMVKLAEHHVVPLQEGGGRDESCHPRARGQA
jgi:hypothetical protein